MTLHPPAAVGRASSHWTGPVDVVYVYFNGDHPAQKDVLQLSRLRHDGPGASPMSQTEISKNPEWVPPVRFHPRNYRDGDELKYSLRSLHKFAPWIRKVFLVTAGELPSWLDLSNEKLTIVPHERLFPDSKHVPTFNPRAVHTQLHRIEGLSEFYLRMSDDMFFGNHASPDDFFPSKIKGHTLFLRKGHTINVDKRWEKESTEWLSLWHTNSLLDSAFGEQDDAQFFKLFEYQSPEAALVGQNSKKGKAPVLGSGVPKTTSAAPPLNPEKEEVILRERARPGIDRTPKKSQNWFSSLFSRKLLSLNSDLNSQNTQQNLKIENEDFSVTGGSSGKSRKILQWTEDELEEWDEDKEKYDDPNILDTRAKVEQWLLDTLNTNVSRFKIGKSGLDLEQFKQYYQNTGRNRYSGRFVPAQVPTPFRRSISSVAASHPSFSAHVAATSSHVLPHEEDVHFEFLYDHVLVNRTVHMSAEQFFNELKIDGDGNGILGEQELLDLHCALYEGFVFWDDLVDALKYGSTDPAAAEMSGSGGGAEGVPPPEPYTVSRFVLESFRDRVFECSGASDDFVARWIELEETGDQASLVDSKTNDAAARMEPGELSLPFDAVLSCAWLREQVESYLPTMRQYRFNVVDPDAKYLRLTDNLWSILRQISWFKSHRPKFFQVQDLMGEEPQKQVIAAFHRFLEIYFPTPSPFELKDGQTNSGHVEALTHDDMWSVKFASAEGS